MKQFIAITYILVVSCQLHAQNVAECENIVYKTYEAINKKNTDPLMPHLSKDFTIAGQTGEIARIVLPQLFNQLNVQVKNIKKISENQTEGLTLVFEAEFGDFGTRASTFVFNKNNELKSLDLLKMEVKTMDSQTSLMHSEQTFFTVPFKRVGNLIAVEAMLNGVKRPFLVDNGAPILVLNSAHIPKDSSQKKLTVSNAEGAGGKISNMDIEKIERFELQGISMDAQKVVSIDLAHLEKESKSTFYGLIGYEIYKDYNLLFDYKKNTLTFIKPEATEEFLKKRFPNNKQVMVPIKMEGHLAVIEGMIQNKKYMFGIDCGAETNLIDVSWQKEIMNNMSKIRKDTLAGADKNAIETISGKLDVLQIGDIQFKKSKTIFSDMTHLNQGYNLKLDGLIGYEILSAQPTLISYKNEKVIFLK